MTLQSDGRLPRIDFVAEVERCPDCGTPMRVGKSRQRTVTTLALGQFTARELLKHCPKCVRARLHGCVALRHLVKPRQQFGYDLVVHAGLARYLDGKQRGEIESELLKRGIMLSDGTISTLCDRFLTLFEALHLSRSPELRAAMQGGYPLHLDATSDRGKGGLFVCLDGWRGWVLMAARIPSEHSDHIQPVLDNTLAAFGDPVAVVRDMGEAGTVAVKALRDRGVPDLICHYHFLAAVGEKLFDQPYSLVRDIVRTSKVRAEIRRLLRELRSHRKSDSKLKRFGPGQVRTDLLALIHWLLEADAKSEPVYPFSLPHREFVQRCQQISQLADSWVPGPRTEPERRALRHLDNLVRRLHSDGRLPSALEQLHRGWQAFCELRDVLRLTQDELPRGDDRSHQKHLPELELLRLQEIEKQVQKYREDLSKRVLSDRTSKLRSPEAVIVKYLERYGTHLFGHPARRAADGSVLAVVERTNNVAEHFFGRGKQLLRRRVGRANLGRDLQQQPAQAALVSNLRHPDYVKVLCGSIDGLVAAFAELDARALRRATPLARDHRDSELQRRVRELREDR